MRQALIGIFSTSAGFFTLSFSYSVICYWAQLIKGHGSDIDGFFGLNFLKLLYVIRK